VAACAWTDVHRDSLEPNVKLPGDQALDVAKKLAAEQIKKDHAGKK
jgi:hypothetical protein